MKKFVIFVIVSTLAIFPQTHAQTPSFDGAAITKDVAGVAHEFRNDDQNNLLVGDAIMFVGSAIRIATYPLAACVGGYYRSQDAETAAMLAGLSLSLITVLLGRFYSENIS